MADPIQVPQPGNGLGDDCRALFTTLLPFLQGVAQQAAGGPRLWVGPVQSFQAPDDWVPLNTPGVATFGTNWAQWGDNNFSRCALRKADNGECTARGLWDFTGSGSANNTFLVSFPKGSPFAPAAGGWDISLSDAYQGFGDVIVSTQGIQYLSGSVTAWTSLRRVSWSAKDRTPYSPRPLSLPMAPPFTPDHILASVQEVDTTKRGAPGPVHTLIPRWTTRTSATGAISLTITACPGLVPLRTYRLTPWLLAR